MTGPRISIIHVFPSFAIGGQQRRLATLIDALGDAFHHTIYSIDGDFTAYEMIAGRQADVAALPLRKSGGLSLQNLKTISERLNREHADLLCTYNWGAIEAAIANKFSPRLPHLHFEDGFGAEETPERQLLRRSLTRRLALLGDTVVLPSSQLYMIARNDWRLGAEKLVRIANGVDTARFAPAARERSAIVTIGFVGALRREKNLARLIRAFARVREKGIAAKLVIAGEGPEKNALSELIAALGVQNEVELLGATGAPEEIYQRIDIFAMSSDTEQAPLSLLEAMACGLPVAATDVGDIKSMTAHENRCFIVQRGSEERLADALAALIENASLRERLGKANRERAVAEFDVRVMTGRYRELFLQVAAKK